MRNVPSFVPGVDFADFRAMGTDKIKKKIELGFEPSDKIVGVVASFTPAKALHLFLEAAAKIAREDSGGFFCNGWRWFTAARARSTS